MKKILFSLLALLSVGMVQAQLNVNYDGETSVKRLNVETNGCSDNIGINVYL